MTAGTPPYTPPGGELPWQPPASDFPAGPQFDPISSSPSPPGSPSLGNFPTAGLRSPFLPTDDDPDSGPALKQRRKRVLIVVAAIVVVVLVLVVLIEVPVVRQSGSGTIVLHPWPSRNGWGFGWSTINTTSFGTVKVSWQVPVRGPTGGVAAVNGQCTNETACAWAEYRGVLCSSPTDGYDAVAGTCTFGGPAGTYTIIGVEDTDFGPGNTITFSFSVGQPLVPT
ncbi:MAG: hypothetical protein KGJ23_11970 [Euryarchaeota archaeon]|nr:hypothetical protein [Euryarchaeota archaeon]MDE1837313.1 hypothetical protein [Euryarchaeota archaeon]MDE1879815.1 hypothetical protein [Euryarchaeota archaeon]MDE2045256.1 hypothetical protein [Thermoplasmata archaeon]